MISPFSLSVCPAAYSSGLSSGLETLKQGLQHLLSGLAVTAEGWEVSSSGNPLVKLSAVGH